MRADLPERTQASRVFVQSTLKKEREAIISAVETFQEIKTTALNCMIDSLLFNDFTSDRFFASIMAHSLLHLLSVTKSLCLSDVKWRTVIPRLQLNFSKVNG